MNLSYNDSTFSIKPDEVHVWIFDLANQKFHSHFYPQFLSQEELDQAHSFKFERDRECFLVRRGILRKLITKYTGLDRADIKYAVNPCGKIFLPDHHLTFNTSHSHNKIALAFSLSHTIGVDIEQIRSLPDIPQIIDRWFSKTEKTELLKLPKDSHLEAFYQIWTQKEAFIKAEGKGLAHSLQDFSVSVDPSKPAKLFEIKNVDPNFWKIESAIPEPGWRVAVCIKAKRNQKVIWFTPEASLP
jgi:4'-phosphopantetheinyl transferase